MTSSKSWLPEAALWWLPLLVLVGGIAVGHVIVPGRRVQIRVWPDERRAEGHR